MTAPFLAGDHVRVTDFLSPLCGQRGVVDAVDMRGDLRVQFDDSFGKRTVWLSPYRVERVDDPTALENAECEAALNLAFGVQAQSKITFEHARLVVEGIERGPPDADDLDLLEAAIDDLVDRFKALRAVIDKMAPSPLRPIGEAADRVVDQLHAQRAENNCGNDIVPTRAAE